MTTIIHICGDCKGGTEKYIRDLSQLFSQYTHIVIHNIPFEIKDNVSLLHIHSVFFASNIHWEILNIIALFKKHHIPIYLTIHDYQWLFEQDAGLSTIDDRENCLDICNREKAICLMNEVDRILIPTQRVFDNYKYFMGELNTAKLYIIPHCDIPIRIQQLYIPKSSNKIINIAYIGTFNEYKGARLFLKLIYNLRTYFDYTIHYHIFGKYLPSDYDNDLREYVHFHGAYTDSTLIEDLYANNIHIITSLSILEETYCYALSLLINSGLPIVYLNRGSLRTRLSSEYPRMFPFEDVEHIQTTVRRAIDYVIAPENQGRCDLIKMSNEVILNEEYKQLYI
jgi:glycosyltransferase involved in cell wall biosynthesis